VKDLLFQRRNDGCAQVRCLFVPNPIDHKLHCTRLQVDPAHARPEAAEIDG
jgi:hypothetical protein